MGGERRHPNEFRRARLECRLDRKRPSRRSLDILCLGMYIHGSMNTHISPSRAPAADRPADFYSADGYCANDSVGYLMRRVLLALTQDTGKRLEPHGLTHAQWGPLFMIRKSGSATVAELARELQMDPGAMTRLLDRLESKGLCKRLRSTDDRRVVNVALTDEGQKAADMVPAAL